MPGESALRGEWVVSRMTCAICDYAWVAVYPICAPRLECDGCGYMNECPPRAGEDEDGEGDE